MSSVLEVLTSIVRVLVKGGNVPTRYVLWKMHLHIFLQFEQLLVSVILCCKSIMNHVLGYVSISNSVPAKRNQIFRVEGVKCIAVYLPFSMTKKRTGISLHITPLIYNLILIIFKNLDNFPPK